MRRRFARRAAIFGIGFLLVFAVVVAVLVSTLTTHFGDRPGGGPFGIVVVIVGGFLAWRAIRAFRTAVSPLGELIEASARVEAGQLGTQVAVRGPREVRALAGAFNDMSARLAAMDEQRRRLLADVSHELRTPLTVIQGNVEAMLDGVYPPDRTHLERILRETHQLERLIEDLRTLSLAESGSLGLQREPTDLAIVAAEVVAGFEAQATGAGVALALESGGGLPELELDPRRIRQVLTNLVSNALRHTPEGGRVTVSTAAEGGGIVLAVTDTGRGMDAETAARAFDRFWRSADSPGAGLGLPIVRDLVQAHGGTVELRSAPGDGTTVRCRFVPSSGAAVSRSRAP